MNESNRRKFLKGSLVTGIVLASGGLVWLKSGKGTEKLAINTMLIQLNNLSNSNIKSKGIWNPSQIFNHLAQSIEFSISGYPKHKSAAFKKTIGTMAFSVFAMRGEMSHGLSEEIPGAPKNDVTGNVKEAISRLKQALLDFDDYNGDYKAHFAYGELTKQEYTYAHIMHIENHLEEIIHV